MSSCCFTLTFAVEVLIENDKLNSINNDEWLSLGPCSEGMKIQYNLYPEYTYDLDVLIWPHVGKIWCGNKYGWVRTWKMENKSWMAFTIRHKIPVKIEEFLHRQIFVVPTNGITALSTNAKNDKTFLIRVSSLKFREQQYFAIIEDKQEGEIDDVKSIIDLIWNNVAHFIPASYFDGVFDIPQPVTDIQHKDMILSYAKERSLNFHVVNVNIMDNNETGASNTKDKGKKKLMETESNVYKLRITGNAILAGSGKVNRLEDLGRCQSNQGQVLAVLSSTNLPTSDDLPIFVINLNKLKQIPAEEFRKAGFSQIYIRWRVGATEYNSESKTLTSKTEILFDEHHVIPIERSMAREVFNVMDDYFEIQLYGIRDGIRLFHHPKLFKDDYNCKFIKKNKDSEKLDDLIACIQMNTQQFFNQPNKMIFGQFPFLPQRTFFTNLKSDCTNHINATRSSEKHKPTFSSSIVLQTHMLLDISIGLLGCKINISSGCFSRLYCFCVKENTPYNILKKITEINEMALISLRKENILTGFFLDMGDALFIFVEGQKYKDIIKVWEITESYDSSLRSFYSSTDTFLGRIYPDMAASGTPFDFLKMRIPLSILMACPPVYVRPALPLPAKTALLKISHIFTGKMYKALSKHEMPTAAELRSFKLELCSPLRYYSAKEVVFNA